MTSTVTINGRSFREVSGDRPKPVAKPKKSKYGNRKVAMLGHTFDSEREGRRWAELVTLACRGHISDLARQVPFVLAPKVKLLGELRAKPAIRYVADFVYFEGGARIVEDIKSDPTAKTAAFRLKLHLMKSVHGIDVRVVR